MDVLNQTAFSDNVDSVHFLPEDDPVRVKWETEHSNPNFPRDSSSSETPIVVDSETQAFYDWYNKLDKNLSAETKDYLVQHYLNERSAQKSFDRELQASSTQYQRAVKDLQAAGLNPFLAIQGLSGSSASSSSGSVSGGNYTQGKSNRATQSTNALKAVLSLLASVAAAIILA